MLIRCATQSIFKADHGLSVCCLARRLSVVSPFGVCRLAVRLPVCPALFQARMSSDKGAVVGRATEKPARGGSDQQALLEELKTVAARLGFEVREEKLLREVGYRVRSGSCRVRETRVILLDRGLPPSAHIDVLAETLAGQPLDDVYLSPVARRLLERAAPERPTSEQVAR